VSPDVASIEPNLVALLPFALCCTVVCVAFLVLAGAFPLASRPDLTGSPIATALALGNAVLLAVLIAGTAWFGFSHLRWTSLVIAGGSVVLFAPGLFHLWPERWRDGRAGLALLFCALGGSIAALQIAGGVLPLA
jgi:cytochrome bd-type quinol oxidase subunit 2